MLKETKNNGVLLSPEQEKKQRYEAESRQREKSMEYHRKKQEVMKELGVIEIAIIKIDPVTGIVPSSVVIPHEWKDGESYLPGEGNEENNAGKKAKKAE